MKDYGSDCAFFKTVTASTSIVTLPAYTMTVGVLFNFALTVSTPDGRSASQIVKVAPLVGEGVQVSISNTEVRFNSEKKLVLYGQLTSANAVTSKWSVETSLGVAVPFSALTRTSQSFTAFETIDQMTFPLSIRRGKLTPGTEYTFKLTAYPTDNPLLISFSKISLISNSLPTGGYTTSDPTSGVALVTQFLISTSGWTSDAANLPLRYSFSYRLTNSAPLLTLAEVSLRAHTSSALPAGLEVLNRTITIQGKATDIFDSSATANQTVTVIPETVVNLSQVTATSLSEAFMVGNINLVYQTVNNVATTLNAVNCSSAPNCTTLGRQQCFQTMNTCGSCYTGLSGILGDSNIECRNTLSTVKSTRGSINSPCLTNSDCLYRQCTNQICTPPALLCPTNQTDTVCSRRGSCAYSDSSGNALKSCTIFDICSASCVCNSGFGGTDCSLSSAALVARSQIRTALSQALVESSKVQDRSPTVLKTLIISLLSAFSPSEVTTLSANKVHSQALQSITSLTSQGMLGDSEYLSLLLAQLVSAFTVPSNSSALYSTTKNTQYPVDAAVSDYQYLCDCAIDSYTCACQYYSTSVLNEAVMSCLSHSTLLHSTLLYPTPLYCTLLCFYILHHNLFHFR